MKISHSIDEKMAAEYTHLKIVSIFFKILKNDMRE